MRRSKNLVLLTLTIGGVLAGLYFATATRVYQSQASLLIMRMQPESMSARISSDVAAKDLMLMDTYRSMLSSDAVLVDVLNSLPPEDRVDFAGVAPTKQLAELRKNIKVSAVRKTNILEISYRSQTPHAAATVVDSVLSAYFRFMEKLHKSSAREILDLLTREKTELQSELKVKEDELLDLKRRMDDVVVREGEKDVSLTARRLLSLSDQALKARSVRFTAESQWVAIDAAVRNGQDLQPHIGALMESVGQDVLRKQLGIGAADASTVARIVNQRLEDQTKLQSLQQCYGPAHSHMRELVERIRTAEEFLRSPQSNGIGLPGMNNPELATVLQSLAQQRYRAAVEREKLETASYEQEKVSARNLQGEISHLEVLNLDLGRLRRFYDLLVARIKDINISKDDGMLKTAILSTPETPTSPVSPSLTKTILLALAASLGGGLALVYFMEMLTDRFPSLEELRIQLGGIPVLAIIRKLEPLAGVGSEAIHVCARPNTPETEGFRTLRTALAFAGDGIRIVSLTSSEPGDGKTTIIANLAAALAQSSKRTLLIDADLRRPHLSPLFGLRGRQGLSTILRQPGPVEDVIATNIHTSAVPKLDIIPSGPRAADASELLGSKRLSEVFAWAESKYDYVLVDSPPAFVSDAAIIGRLVDGVLLIVRPDRNQRKTVTRTVDGLTTLGITLFGLVVNCFAFDESKYSGYESGFGYGGDYQYGYGLDEATDGSEVVEDGAPRFTRQSA